MWSRVARLSLRARLSIGVIAIVFTGTLGLTSAALSLVKRNMQAAIAEEQFARIAAIADAVDQKFIFRRVLLRTFAESLQTQQFTSSASLQDFLVAHRASLKESFDNLAIVDAKGTLVANLNGTQLLGKANIADRDYIRNTLARRAGVISQPYRNRYSDLAQVAITQPVLDDGGQVAWVLTGSINLAEENFLGELARIKFGHTGYMFIMNTSGILIDHPRKERILKHVDSEGGTNAATARAISGFEGATEGLNRFGVYGLYAFKQIKQTNWILGSIFPRDEAFEQIQRLEKIAWGVALLLTLLAGGLTYMVLYTQLAPLARLSEHMEQARRRSEYRPLQGPLPANEIGDMARTFEALMSERETAQGLISKSEDYLRSVLEHAPDAFVSMDQSGQVTEWNRQAEATFGWSRTDAIGRKLSGLLIPPAMHAAHEAGLARFAQTGKGPVVDVRIEVMALHKAGHQIPIELSVVAIHQKTGYASNAFLRDISDRREAQAKLAASEKRVRDIADNLPALIGYFDSDLQMHFANEPARRLFKLKPGERYDMMSVMGDEPYAQSAPYVARVRAGERVSFEAQALVGTASHFQSHMVPDFDSHGVVQGFYTMTFDVSALKAAELKLLVLSQVDPLTQLPNRRRFLERLDEGLARAKREGKALAVIFLDVDGFKAINDTHGHALGDEVLVEFARRLRAGVRETDVVARLGGDEFVIVLESLHSASEAVLVAAKLVATMQMPMDLQQASLKVTSSMGIAMIGPREEQESGSDQPGTLSAAELIARADQALYAAKRAGRDQFSVFQDGITKGVSV